VNCLRGNQKTWESQLFAGILDDELDFAAQRRTLFSGTDETNFFNTFISEGICHELLEL